MLIKKLIMIFGIAISCFVLAQNQDDQAASDATAVNPNVAGQGYEAFLVDFNETGKGSKEEDLFNNNNWVLELNSSADFIINKQLTYAKNVVDKGGINNIGVRVNFPEYPNNSFATLTPPFPFIFELSQQDNSLGVVNNVGAIRRIIAKVAGRGFPYAILVDLQDINSKVTSYKIGQLNYYGWKEINWDNREILNDLSDREDFDLVSPIYPRILPSVKLNSIKFFRNGENQGGNFISYVGWIKMIYNKAVALEAIRNEFLNPDSEGFIEDEDVWKIQSERNDSLNITYDDLFENFKLTRRIQRSKVNAEGTAGTAPFPAPPGGNNDNANNEDNAGGGDGNNNDAGGGGN